MQFWIHFAMCFCFVALPQPKTEQIGKQANKQQHFVCALEIVLQLASFSHITFDFRWNHTVFVPPICNLTNFWSQVCAIITLLHTLWCDRRKLGIETSLHLISNASKLIIIFSNEFFMQRGPTMDISKLQ